jgi:hypothetical protein
VKLRELLKKIRRRPARSENGDQSSAGVNDAFTVSSERAASSWIPSQQDRPRH